jgi:hypothetical protein
VCTIHTPTNACAFARAVISSIHPSHSFLSFHALTFSPHPHTRFVEASEREMRRREKKVFNNIVYTILSSVSAFYFLSLFRPPVRPPALPLRCRTVIIKMNIFAITFQNPFLLVKLRLLLREREREREQSFSSLSLSLSLSLACTEQFQKRCACEPIH